MRLRRAIRAVSGGAFGGFVLHDGHAGLSRTMGAVGRDTLRIVRGMEISMSGFFCVFGFQFRRTRTSGAQRATDGGRYTTRDHDRDGNRGNCCRHCPAKVRLGTVDDFADIQAHDGRTHQSAEQVLVHARSWRERRLGTAFCRHNRSESWEGSRVHRGGGQRRYSRRIRQRQRGVMCDGLQLERVLLRVMCRQNLVEHNNGAVAIAR